MEPETTVDTDYPAPVQVNGYLCRNCTDVDLAKKHVDPAHPRSGPYGINAKDDPTANKPPAVIFGGALSGLNNNSNMIDNRTSSNVTPGSSPNAWGSAAPGTQLNLLA